MLDFPGSDQTGQAPAAQAHGRVRPVPRIAPPRPRVKKWRHPRLRRRSWQTIALRVFGLPLLAGLATLVAFGFAAPEMLHRSIENGQLIETWNPVPMEQRFDHYCAQLRSADLPPELAAVAAEQLAGEYRTVCEGKN